MAGGGGAKLRQSSHFDGWSTMDSAFDPNWRQSVKVKHSTNSCYRIAASIFQCFFRRAGPNLVEMNNNNSTTFHWVEGQKRLIIILNLEESDLNGVSWKNPEENKNTAVDLDDSVILIEEPIEVIVIDDDDPQDDKAELRQQLFELRESIAQAAFAIRESLIKIVQLERRLAEIEKK